MKVWVEFVQAARPGENGEVSFYRGTTNKIMRGTFAEDK
jgi:hypothetical protein